MTALDCQIHSPKSVTKEALRSATIISFTPNTTPKAVHSKHTMNILSFRDVPLAILPLLFLEFCLLLIFALRTRHDSKTTPVSFPTDGAAPLSDTRVPPTSSANDTVEASSSGNDIEPPHCYICLEGKHDGVELLCGVCSCRGTARENLCFPCAVELAKSTTKRVINSGITNGEIDYGDVRTAW